MANNDEGKRTVGLGGMDADKSNRPLSTVDERLKQLGIIFHDKSLLEKYYQGLSAILITDVMTLNLNGMMLDLNMLPKFPIPVKEIFIKWLIEVNMPRLEAGEDPIVTLSLVLKCPLWKVIKPPFKKLKLTPEGLFNSRSTSPVIGKQQKFSRINKK